MTRYSQTGSTAESEGVNSCDIGQKSSISVRFKYDQPGMIWCQKNETDAKNTPMVKLKGSSTWCLCPLCSMLDCRFSDGWKQRGRIVGLGQYKSTTVNTGRDLFARIHHFGTGSPSQSTLWLQPVQQNSESSGICAILCYRI